MIWVNAVVQGILLGGLYALFATGLSLAFGVMRFVNLAHGDIAILAAFVALSLSTHSRHQPAGRTADRAARAFVVGYVLQRLVFDRVVGVDPAFQIVATFGCRCVIQNALLEKYTADTQGLNVGGLETASDQDQRHDQHRLAAADHVAVRGRRARRRWRCSSSGPGWAARSGRRPTIPTRRG